MATRLSLATLLVSLILPATILADGKVMPPRNYTGSLEERGQEAIIIFHHGENNTATEDLILKIQVVGDAKEFAWIVPFPNKPKIAKESPQLFKELFRYVEYRRRARYRKPAGSGAKSKNAAPASDSKVEVLSREVVGDFDITVVQEKAEGGLNPWLKKEGFQQLKNADDVLDFYRKKKYVYACIKVTREAIEKADVDAKNRPQAKPAPFRGPRSSSSMQTHPLRFTFQTGGTDSAYFPMKLTGLQKERFDVNLYVFYRYWLNDRVSRFGYEHRGFQLKYRDWDTKQCVANGGKSYSLPQKDPFLRNAPRMKTVTSLFQKLHPGSKYYLTNIYARDLDPADVRDWSDDLWLFPYYRDPATIPDDVLQDGPASTGFPNAQASVTSHSSVSASSNSLMIVLVVPCAVLIGLLVGVAGFWWFQSSNDPQDELHK